MVFLVLGKFQAGCQQNRESLSKTHAACQCVQAVQPWGLRDVQNECRAQAVAGLMRVGGLKCSLLGLPCCGPWDGSQGQQSLLPVCLPSSHKGPV